MSSSIPAATSSRRRTSRCLCLDVLDLLDVDYEVMGGVGQCCGVYQFREGDFDNNSKVAYATIDGPRLGRHLDGAVLVPELPDLDRRGVAAELRDAASATKPFDLNPFLVFLADRADTLAGADAAPGREAHRAARAAGASRRSWPRSRSCCRSSPAPSSSTSTCRASGPRPTAWPQLPEFKRELVRARVAPRSPMPGSTTLATIYHACHREICDAGDGRSFEVVNFMEMLGEGLGLDSEDLYKRLKLIARHRRHHRRDHAADRGARPRPRHRARRAGLRVSRRARGPAELSSCAPLPAGFPGCRPRRRSGDRKMITRPIPSTGEAMPVVGLGTWQVFDVGADDGGARSRCARCCGALSTPAAR